jgi:hypothetical protein
LETFFAELKTKIALLKINNSLNKNSSNNFGVVHDSGGDTVAIRQRQEGK